MLKFTRSYTACKSVLAKQLAVEASEPLSWTSQITDYNDQ
jgi:hypothetical protein